MLLVALTPWPVHDQAERVFRLLRKLLRLVPILLEVVLQVERQAPIAAVQGVAMAQQLLHSRRAGFTSNLTICGRSAKHAATSQSYLKGDGVNCEPLKELDLLCKLHNIFLHILHHILEFAHCEQQPKQVGFLHTVSSHPAEMRVQTTKRLEAYLLHTAPAQTCVSGGRLHRQLAEQMT